MADISAEMLLRRRHSKRYIFSGATWLLLLHYLAKLETRKLAS